MIKEKEYKTLPWEYCACCKSHAILLGSQNFSLYDNLKGQFYLESGHGSGLSLGIFNSFEDADRAVRRIAKPLVEKELAALQKSAAALGLTTEPATQGEGPFKYRFTGEYTFRGSPHGLVVSVREVFAAVDDDDARGQVALIRKHRKQIVNTCLVRIDVEERVTQIDLPPE